jgi:antitoxin (DNA-binding transcriptional repressor) of toxin-antitoxin stability system
MKTRPAVRPIDRTQILLQRVEELTMVVKTIDVSEVNSQLPELLSLLSPGSEIILTRDETPVARLVAVAPPDGPRVAGLHAGAAWTADDFDAPLPDDFWTAET